MHWVDWLTAVASYILAGFLVTETVLTWCSSRAPWIAASYERSSQEWKIAAYGMLMILWPVALVGLAIRLINRT